MWSYDDIAIVVMVVEEGSFTAAAKRLGMPTSTVSRRVQQLEDALQMTLLERSSRRIALTEKGRELVQLCAPSIRQLKQSVRELQDQRDVPRGLVRLTAPVFMVQEYIGDWVLDFMADYPDIRIDLLASDSFEDLIDREIDLAIRVGPLRDSNFVARSLVQSRMLFCAAPDYLKAAPPLQSVADLEQHAFLEFEYLNLLSFSDPNTTELYKLPLQTRMKSNDLTLLRNACATGMGVSCLPDQAVASLLQRGQVVEVLSSVTIEPLRDIFALYPSRKHLAMKTRVLVDYLRQRFAGFALSPV